MYVSEEKIEEALRVFKNHHGIMRTSEVLNAGIHERVLYHMYKEGYLEKLQRGVYQLSDQKPLGNPDLVIVASKIPNGVLCLLSALDFHDMTDQIPHQVHIALSRTSRNPVLDYPPLKVYRFSKKTLHNGVETHLVDGISVNIFSPAKTIADCFKFRNQIGIDVAIEALKKGINEEKATYKDILKYAEICKVQNIIKPYLQMLGHG